ncbi:LexA family transcriptional regulator [Cloacibacillus sp. An23]|uniref:helix-turn-helix domain-containing protein n=1 Tax=Cloacibacillus sp. An23 TaxID=1965591 RepID=UPI000B382ECE|nr:LexA family transcriptional regulator [Cloacibacillus sp. An23]OUO94758.1 hypothetical protein B5F39_02505 [Cloacibacillus sp. An23]
MFSVAERLKALRESNNMTQKQLADLVGVAQVMISKYEKGLKKPGFETTQRLAKVFDVSTDYLMGVTDHPRNASPVFAAMLREFIEEDVARLDEIANRTNIPREDIERYAKGEIEPAGGRMRIITQAMESMGWRPRLKYKEPQEKSNVRKVKTIAVPVTSMEFIASCGTGAGLYGVEATPNDIVYIDPSDIQHYDDLDPPFGIHIEGESMVGAGLDEGCIAVVNPADEVISGEMALVVWNDNWFIKWVMWFPDGSVELRSANPAYAPIRIEKEYATQKEWFWVRGKVVSIIRKNKPPRAF